MSKKVPRPRFVDFNFLTNFDREKRFSQKEGRMAGRKASDFLSLPKDFNLFYDCSKFGDDFTPFFWIWKTITTLIGKNWKRLGNMLSPGTWWTSVPSFMELVQDVRKLSSISRALLKLSFRRRPILCTALYRNPKQVSNFGGAFDQLFLTFFYEIFTEDASLLFPHYRAKRVKNDQKLKIRGGIWAKNLLRRRVEIEKFFVCILFWYIS